MFVVGASHTFFCVCDDFSMLYGKEGSYIIDKKKYSGPISCVSRRDKIILNPKIFTGFSLIFMIVVL